MSAKTKNFNVKTDPKLACSCCGVEGITQRALDNLQKIRNEYGPMSLTSGYRCENHPVEARKKNPGTGRHCSGTAFDVKCTNSADRWRLVQLAFKYGATGVGVADTFVHIDWDITRKPYMWLY